LPIIEQFIQLVENILSRKEGMVLLSKFIAKSMVRFKNNTFTLALHVGFWLLFFLFISILISNYLPFDQAVVRIFLNGVVMVFAFYFNALFLVNSLLERKKYVGFLVSASFLVFVTGVFRFLLLKIFERAELSFAIPGQTENLLVFSFLNQLVIVVVSTIFQLLQNRVRRDRQRQQLQNMQNEAQLNFLKTQINPHFLFNTLNNIYALSVIRSEKTPAMILKLSELLRYVIYDGREKRVLLEQEINHIKKFIELFQMKSENELNITMQVEGSPNGLRIEPMILIPIVENCFKHTDFDTNPGAYVKIILAIHNKSIKFITLNTKDESDLQKDKTGGVGLENIKKRLDLNYFNQYELIIQNKKQIFEVNLSMELDNEKDNSTIN